ncbi:unnamed protein product [Mytilus coruscus]|uniref:PDZ domain-containing protein n=1 Tax=Mytilus coruscus TaxID=42192 RepID=A0A6J8E9V6_MYTCO|nr:unnamed protein product [Mytilus coruscus]
MFNNQTKNRTDEHLSPSDRIHEIDNVYHEKHETHQEQDQNIQPLMEFTDIDKIFNNNESTDQANMTIRNNKYLTSDFDIKRDSIKSGLMKYPWINRTDKSEIELNMEPCSKRTYVDPRRRSTSDIKDFPGRERSSSVSSQSDYFQNLYKKYPQAFQYRSSDARGHRQTRRIFNSGLRVHFEDDSSSVIDTGSVCSERQVSKWDREIENMLGSRIEVDRDCLTSPTPSMMSDSSTRDRLTATSDTLKRLLQHRKYHRAKLASDIEYKLKRSSISSDISEKNQDPLSALAKELEYREQILQSMNRKHKHDHYENEGHYMNKSSHWRVHSPDSTPDSAIDVDTSSVKSSGSVDKHINTQSKTQDMQSYGQNRGNIEAENIHRKQGKILVRKGVVHKDSDVDSGIVPTSVSDDIQLDPPSYNSTMYSRSDVYDLPVSHTQNFYKPGQRSRPSPIKADHSLTLNLNYSDPTDEDDSIAQEIITAKMSTDLHILPQKNRPNSKVHFEDEIDDTDPRLGIPAMTGEEKTIAERYRRRKSPMPFVVHRTCVTSRDERPKTNSQNRQSRSDNRVSILCSPRDLTNFNHFNGAGNGNLKKEDSQEVLHSQKLDKLKPKEKYSAYYSSQPNLSTTNKYLPTNEQHLKKQSNRYTHSLANYQTKHCQKSATVDEHEQVFQKQTNGVLLQETKPLSKSQPNLAPVMKSSNKGRLSLSRTSSSNSDQSSHTLVSSQLALNVAEQNMYEITRTNHSVPFSAKNTKKKLHFKKYFKTKRGKYNPSLEENCYPAELGHGTSMPDLTGDRLKQNVQYSKVSKHHQSMQNIYFRSKDLESGSDEEDVQQKSSRSVKPKHKSKGGAVNYNDTCDNVTDGDSGVDDKLPKFHTNGGFRNSYSSDSSDQNIVIQHSKPRHHPKRTESDSSSCLSANGEIFQKDVRRKSKLTPYESSVVHLDKQGINVNELIDSDSDSFSAKCVVIDKVQAQKHVHIMPNTGTIHGQEIEMTLANERKYKKKGDIHQSSAKISNPILTVPNYQKPEVLPTHLDNHIITSHDQHIACDQIDPDHQNVCARRSVSSSVSSMSSQDQVQHYNEKDLEIMNDEGKGSNSNRTYVIQGKSSVEEVQHQTESSAVCNEIKGEEMPAHIYAEVNFKSKIEGENNQEGRQLHSKLSASTPDIAANFDKCVDIDIEENPPIPDKRWNRESNLVKSKELSASRQSLSDKMGNIKKSAKSKFKAIRKAVSMDKGIDDIGNEGQTKVKDKKKSKEKKGLFGFFSKKKSKQKAEKSIELSEPSPEDAAASDLHFECNSLDSVQDHHTGSRLCHINSDGTQEIEIQKPQNKAIDFFISRGNAQFKHGVFVSRFISSPTNMYSGLLSVGDEIIEVNGLKVQDLLLDDVYSLLSNAENLVITILPLLARKDI